ncbi:MAG: cupredoxin family protein [Rubrivivax sp.]|nr:cupredoxin family protein [Rubrivivax sp.]
MNETTTTMDGRRAALTRMAATAAALTLPLLASRARAHTDKPHAPKAGPVVKEQKDWGIAGDAKNAKRSIAVGMADSMRFTPERIEVRQGETLRFVVRNTGKVMHEFVIGTKAENAKHAEWMVKFPNMEHDEPYMAHVPPGKTGEIVWTFNRAGEFEFACLIAGHYQSGMVGTIRVAPAGKA